MPVPAQGPVVAGSTSLITRAELSAYLGGAEIDNTRADQAIATSSGWVEDKTGWAFTARTATVVLPVAYGTDVPLPFKPIRSISAVSIGGTPITDYVLSGAGSALTLYGWWSEMVDVTLTIDYGTLTTPASIKGVVAELAGAMYDERLTIQNERIDDYAVAYTGVLSEISKSTLALYGAQVSSVPVARY